MSDTPKLIDAVEGDSRPPSCSPFRLVVGKTYELQNGDRVKIVERFAKHRGYETVMDEHGCHRYDRSTDQEDTGRVTGTAHDYSCPLNIRRENYEDERPRPVS